MIAVGFKYFSKREVRDDAGHPRLFSFISVRFYSAKTTE